MAFQDYRIASGWDVALGSLTNIETIIPSGDVLAFVPVNSRGTYTPGVFRARMDGLVNTVGFPALRWRLSGMTFTQHRYLMTTYCNSGYSGKVTIYTRTDANSAYSRLNAIMRLPQLPQTDKEISAYRDVEIAFTRLHAAS